MYSYCFHELPVALKKKGKFREALAKELKLHPEQIFNLEVERFSLDSRRKGNPHWSYNVRFDVQNKLKTFGNNAKGLVEEQPKTKDPKETALTGSMQMPQHVDIIGAGPSGITVAGDLSHMGFAVEIFEMEAQCGGVLRYGIPEYRLPKEVVAREIRYIEKMGVVIHRKTHVGYDITVDSLFEQGFDAVFIGTGLGKPRSLEIPIWQNGRCISEGEHPVRCADLKRIRMAAHFLRRVELISEGFMNPEETHVEKGARVWIIGCGNTAMDASRTALRIGAKSVNVIYNRGIDTMSALHAEYDDAVKEGVQFNWWSQIVEIHVDENLDITEIVLETTEPDKEPTRQTLPADNVIMAIGATPNTKIVRTTSGLENDDRKFLITREIPYGMTTRRGVFAGGDVANRQATVVHAMQDAKHVAEGIAQYVKAVKLMEAIS